MFLPFYQYMGHLEQEAGVELGLAVMELVLVAMVLVQEVMVQDREVMGLVVTDLVALDQVDMGPALDQVVLAQDQAAMDLVEQGLFLVFILLEVKDWGQESHPSQV